MIRSLFQKHQTWILPLLAASFGSILIWNGISSYKAKIGHNMKLISVLVSAQALPVGHVLRETDLLVKRVPKKFLPIGAVRRSDQKSVVGKPITRTMAGGEMFLWPSIDTGLGPAGPARRIADGYRGIALTADSVSSVAHAIRAKDHVDIIVTGTFPGNDHPTTLTLLQNVAVLRVGEEGQEREGEYGVISLMVLPKEVPIIAHAAQHGRILLVLRNPSDDRTPKDLPMVSSGHVMESGFRNSLQEERNRRVEIIRGGKLSIDQ